MKLAIIGTRGIPAQHGGFETFAERLALYLVEKNWDVTVYCQEYGHGSPTIDSWCRIHRVQIPIARSGALGTVLFDWKSTLHSMREQAPVLTLGYNTALFSLLFRIKGVPNVINMDGLEWRRQKWNLFERFWLYLNERAGCFFGDHLIADHPNIKKHLSSRVSAKKITMIPYGADIVGNSDVNLLNRYNLLPNQYCIVIARPEPENSILEIVSAFSKRKRRMKLVLLGKYDVLHNIYHQKIHQSASEEVVFLGAIYEKTITNALRFFARLYIHGHTVGGTNPSLIESLGAGAAVLAHDNPFNRWVAGPDAHYFKDESDCTREMDLILCDDQELKRMRFASQQRHREEFLWEKVLKEYEALLTRWQK